jgi:TPR repeat protein
MKTAAAIGMLFAGVALPVLGGPLEDGIKAHERGDYTKALREFKAAGAQGNAEAQRRLGFMYYHGEGVTTDDARALSLFEKAADAGDVESMSNLAKMYEYGMSVAPDIARAAEWYRKAADRGDVGSQMDLGILYYMGRGASLDRVEAVKWWMLVLKKGGAFAAALRPQIESAEGKLTPEELAEARRRAAEWIGGRAR